MLEFLDKTGPGNEEEQSRLKEKQMQQNKVLGAVSNPRDRVNTSVFPADVQQTALIKEEASEEWNSVVDQNDPEILNIKEEEEELRNSLDVEQLSVKEETDDTRFSFTAVPLKSEDDEKKSLFSQLHQHQVEDGDLPTSSSADQMKTATGGKDCGRTEIQFYRLDVQQTVLIKDEAPEEWSSVVDQNDPEILNIKEEEEELRNSLDVEQLSVKEETDDTRFSFTAVPLKSEDDEEKPLFSQLHEHQVEDGDLPSSSSADQMKAATGGEDYGGADIQFYRLDGHHMTLFVAETSEEARSDMDQRNPEPLHMKLHQHQVEDEDLPTSSLANQMKATTGGEGCEGAGTTRNQDLYTHEDDSSSSETEVSEDDDEDVNDPDSQLQDSSDSGSEPEDSVTDWKESRAPESGVNTVNKFCSFSKCEKPFLHNESVQRNKTGHSRVKSSSCLVSEKCFRAKKNEGLSKKIQSRQNSFSCDDCGKIFNRKCLNKRMRIHTGEKQFVCDVCGQRFGQRSNLNRHMRIHTGQKPFACDVCGQRFGQKSTLNAHMRIHSGQKPFACDGCGQMFGCKSSLNRHMRIHTGQKPFACDVCGRRFGHKSSLNIHISIHTGQKQFACEVCGQRFRHKCQLNTHMIIHTGQNPFACDFCGEKFRNNSNLKSHLKIHTGGETVQF